MSREKVKTIDDRTMSKVKEIQLEILKYVDKLCEENELKYYIVGGTLLGAVRHKGFIPWDDDIDIAMFREDYNKFIKIAIDSGNTKFFIQNFETDPNYQRYITKVRMDGTKFVEKAIEEMCMHHGIYIDIFPLDKIKEGERKTLDLKVYIAEKALLMKKIKGGMTQASTGLKASFKKILKVLLTIIPDSIFISIVDHIYEYANKTESKYVTSFSSQYGWRKQKFPIDVYGEGTLLEFEGYEFVAPKEWETVLKSLYGDYMKLPPIDRRNSGHEVVEIDLGKYK